MIVDLDVEATCAGVTVGVAADIGIEAGSGAGSSSSSSLDSISVNSSSSNVIVSSLGYMEDCGGGENAETKTRRSVK